MSTNTVINNIYGWTIIWWICHPYHSHYIKSILIPPISPSSGHLEGKQTQYKSARSTACHGPIPWNTYLQVIVKLSKMGKPCRRQTDCPIPPNYLSDGSRAHQYTKQFRVLKGNDNNCPIYTIFVSNQQSENFSISINRSGI